MQASFRMCSRMLMSTYIWKTIRVGTTYLRGATTYASECKETQHVRPHIHIDYGKERHIASYALDTGERLAGNLDARYDKAISAWNGQSQQRLFKIWAAIQNGIDPEILIAELQGDDW